MARINEEKATKLRNDLTAAVRYNRAIRNDKPESDECPGCFGAGQGARCCICGGRR
jgi:hypothetical protein